MKYTDYVFYVEPRDSHTNEVFAGILADDLRLSKRVVNDEKGRRIAETLWPCTLNQLKHFEASRSDQHLDFLTYSEKVATGSIQRFKLKDPGFRKKSRQKALLNRMGIVRKAKRVLAN